MASQKNGSVEAWPGKCSVRGSESHIKFSVPSGKQQQKGSNIICTSQDTSTLTHTHLLSPRHASLLSCLPVHLAACLLCLFTRLPVCLPACLPVGSLVHLYIVSLPFPIFKCIFSSSLTLIFDDKLKLYVYSLCLR